MTTMYSAGAMLAMMAFLVLAVCGPLFAVRVLGGQETGRAITRDSEYAGQHEAAFRPGRRAARGRRPLMMISVTQ